MFRRWFDGGRGRLHEPNAMVRRHRGRRTAARRPGLVLLKGLDERGFVFYTNLDSRKGRELAGQPGCALLFPWHDLQRQVRVEGRPSRLPRSEVDGVLRQPPARLPARRLGLAAVARWSPPRAALDGGTPRRLARFAGGRRAACPTDWGGYVVVPESVEFWQGRKSRMHDRLVYLRDAGRATPRRGRTGLAPERSGAADSKKHL